MSKYFEKYKILIVASTISGLYLPAFEKIYGSRWYVKMFKLLSVLPTVCLSVYFAVSLKYLFFDEAKLISKLLGALMSIYGFFSASIVFSFFFLRKDIMKMFELWDSSFTEELFSEDREVLLKKNRRITNGWLKIFGGLSVTSAFLYSLQTYFTPSKTLEHPSGLPYRHQSPDFELVATLDFTASLFGFATLITFDSITMVLFSLEEAQFVHLKDSLNRIIEIMYISDSGEMYIHDSKKFYESRTSDEKKTRLETRHSRKEREVLTEVDKKLRIWISHHHQVLKFHEELQRIYAIPIAIKFLAFVLIICLCSFLTVSDGGFSSRDAIMSIIFCCNNYALFYVTIQFADSIKDAGKFMFEDAFGSAWYIYPKKFKTIFQIILMRSNRPVRFTAFRIYPLSSSSFLKILSSAYSFFTFLLHVTRKKN